MQTSKLIRLSGGPHHGLELEVPLDQTTVELGRSEPIPGLKIVDTEPDNPDFLDVYEHDSGNVFRFVRTATVNT